VALAPLLWIHAFRVVGGTILAPGAVDPGVPIELDPVWRGLVDSRRVDMRVERLRAVPLFAGCSDQELRSIAMRVDEVDISAGQTICRKGGNAGNFFIILAGKAEVDAPQGKRTLAAGDFFGEIALLDNGPRTATVRAATALRCYVLGPAQFQEVLRQSVDIAVKMLHVVTHRLREASPLPTG